MIIKSVQVTDAKRTIACADVEIINGKISAITPRPCKPVGVLIPGFIDLHIHGYGGDDVMDSTAAVTRVSEALKATGVTAFMPTVMTAPWSELKTALSNVAKAKFPGARFLGVHLEGPFISLQKKGAHNEQSVIKPTPALINELIKASNNQIRLATIAPEIFDSASYEALLKAQVTLSLGHSNATAAEARAAFKAGASTCTHFWNAMSGFENRKQGLAFAALTTPGIWTEVICDLLHVDRETLMYTINAFTPNRIVAVTDALKATGTPDGVSVSGGLAVEKSGVKITLKGTETLAGSGAIMFDNFKNLLSLGYALEDVIKMTSYNAAQRFKLPYGLITPGAPADLLVLDLKLSTIKTVLIDGK